MQIVKNSAVHRCTYPGLRGLLDMLLVMPSSVRGHPMIEVGSHIGESACIFSLVFSPVYAIDPFLDNGLSGKHGLIAYDEFQKRIAGRNIIHIPMGSKEACDHLPDDVAIVYLDGAHDYDSVLTDIENYAKKIKFGGYLCGHDYDNPEYPDVQKAIEQQIGDPDMLFEDGSWLWQIK